MERALKAFLDFLAQDQAYSGNTIAAYRNDLTQLIAFLQQSDGSPRSWDQVDEDLVGAYVAELRKKKYASSTVARKVAAIKSFFHFLRDKDRIDVDPTLDLDSPKVKKRLPQSLSARQIEQLLTAPPRDGSAKSLRDRALLALLYATGMRVTELVSLSIEDIDMDKAEVRCEGKDNLGRVLPLTAEAAEAVVAYLERGRPHLIREPDETALFLNHRGQRLTRQGLWLIIKVYARQADLPAKVTPHTLRHSFASHKLDQGIELREIQQLLGHANISTTHIYTQVSSQSADPE